jgi:hypothetical protein
MTDRGWYLRRLSRMGPAEIVGRAGDAARKRHWRHGFGEPATASGWFSERRFTGTLPAGTMASLPEAGVARLLRHAEELMDGRAEFFGVTRRDMVAPDWSADPRTGRRAPDDAYAFDIPYRDELAVGDIKQIWEPSRHQHLTVLAAAYAATGEERFAQRVADHLKSWWSANPPLRGVHWVSGIELGIRLISWVWVRRLLDPWPGAAGLFEDNPEALHQIRAHQRWLAGLPSRGSSANNHAIAEAAGALVAASAFDWFPESTRWRARALAGLDTHLRANTFASGLNREQASEYHGLVAELGLTGVIEAEAAGVAAPESTWLVLQSMTDALAAVVDSAARPPRQGDGDDGFGLILDGAGTDRWASLLATGEALFGRLGWWPELGCQGLRAPLLSALLRLFPPVSVARPNRRPDHFADAGMSILRTRGQGEIWCRCDAGPHGFGSIAAHAHADALSVEVRHDGVDVLADPGTYCYHGQPEWRSYFRSTLGHNTLALGAVDQSRTGGPFLWTRQAHTTVLAAPAADGDAQLWCAEHDGYAPAVHRRSVRLDAVERALVITDEILGGQEQTCVLAFHLGPGIAVALDARRAVLRWSNWDACYSAELALPGELSWSVHRGEADPPLGWYSPGFGRRVPAAALLGVGSTGAARTFSTVLRFRDCPLTERER